jgi:membrane-bound ClpP family serine protease
MPTWGEILKELQNTPGPAGTPDFDRVRRKYLRALSEYTKRSAITYASDFLSGSSDPTAVAINLGDMQALMEVVKDLPGPKLDLILHTPGGSPEALEAMVRYLRTRFTHIRAFIPLAAMSAGTMWALACDEIVMGKHSQLGPIDPQFALAFGEQVRFAPAQAVLDQFDYGVKECGTDPSKLPAWITILRSYGPSLLQECRSAQQLSESLVSTWLARYMFQGEADADEHAKRVAHALADYGTHYSHSRPVDRDQARAHGLKIVNLEADQRLQDAVLSVHHATMHTLGGSAAAKIVENNLGRTFAVMQQTVQIALGPPPGSAPAPGQGPPPPKP